MGENMAHLTPFLLFAANCAEAMRLYQSCLGGELEITRVGDMPMTEKLPPEHGNKVAHAHLKSGALEFSASDWQHPTGAPRQGNPVAMYISGATYTQLRDKL